MGVVELIIWLLGEEQQAMAIVANAFNSDHPKQTMVLPEGSCGEDMGLSLVRRAHWWWSI
jgi:hypothetical protein